MIKADQYAYRTAIYACYQKIWMNHVILLQNIINKYLNSWICIGTGQCHSQFVKKIVYFDLNQYNDIKLNEILNEIFNKKFLRIFLGKKEALEMSSRVNKIINSRHSPIFWRHNLI